MRDLKMEQSRIQARQKDMRIVTRSGDLRRIDPAKRCWGFPVTDHDGNVIYPPASPKLKAQKPKSNTLGIAREEARAFFRQFHIAPEGLAEEVGERDAKASERELMGYLDPVPRAKLGDLMKK